MGTTAKQVRTRRLMVLPSRARPGTGLMHRLLAAQAAELYAMRPLVASWQVYFGSGTESECPKRMHFTSGADPSPGPHMR